MAENNSLRITNSALRIDFHTHIFPDKIAADVIDKLSRFAGIPAFTNGTLDGLKRSTDAAQIDLSVILPVATNTHQVEKINSSAAELNEKFSDAGIFSFGCIHPESANFRAELSRVKNHGLKGIKIHPDYQRVMIDDVRFMNIIEYADALDLIILTHAGVDIGLPELVHCPPDKLRKVLDTLKPKKFIAAHYGGWKQWQEVYEYLAGENVYLDTAFTFDFIEQDMFLKILKKHDENKILFATDSPWSYATKDIEKIQNMPIDEAIKKKIFSENANRLLRL